MEPEISSDNMKPDDIVNTLKNKWGLSITRRTVLTYEKDGLASPPAIETGKYKEYPPTTLAEIIASWGLIHGEYGLRPKKVAEIREKALRILYKFDEIWERELDIPEYEIKDLPGLIRNNKSWAKAADFFAFNWIMVRMNVMCAINREAEASIKLFLETGLCEHIPALSITSMYNVSDTKVEHLALDVDIKSRESRGIIYLSLFEEPDSHIIIEYLHPEDLAMTLPID